MGVDRDTPRVAIIGAGFAGLGMGTALKREGIESFTIFEEGDDVGGIWRENTYPGCSCDVPSQLYSFSFQPYRNASMRFPGQRAILDYLREVADRQGMWPHLRTNTPIASCRFDDDAGTWSLTTASGESHTADVVVSGVGQLHRPYVPSLPGSENFAGAAFHTARWDHTQDLTGRDVAIIGSGSSGAQLMTAIAGVAHRVSMYQRTANWVFPKPAAQFGPIRRWAFDRVPPLQSAYRAIVHHGADAVLSPIISRGWSARPAQGFARLHLRSRIKDPALRAKLTPDHPIGCKRFLVDSSFYPTLTRDDVELITDPIRRVTADGIQTDDGVHRRADVIVYATGFRTTEFLEPIDVHGRHGTSLREQWADGAEAYLGLALPDFPNLFMIAGPNSFIGHGSNIFVKECQIRYIMGCIRLLRDRPGVKAVEVAGQTMDDYRGWLDAAVDNSVFAAGCQGWYQTQTGRITNPWPSSARHFDRLTRRDPAPAFVSVPTPVAVT